MSGLREFLAELNVKVHVTALAKWKTAVQMVALAFLIATLSSYFAMRTQSTQRLHWLERIADTTFITAMLLLTAACFIITYALNA